MQVHVFRIEAEEQQRFLRFLTSDWHLGHVNSDKKLIKSELEIARQLGARVLVNGDVFDAISPRDKRHKPSQEDKEIRGRDDKLTAMVDMAFAICEQYADLIDVIGIGNHEESWIKYGFSDPVGELVKRLNATLEKQGSQHRVRHGGIQGYVRTQFIMTRLSNKLTSSVTHDLLYQHGAGGDAPVTKGAIDAYRRQKEFLYDCLTFGHKHNSTRGDDVLMYLSRSNRIRYRERLHVQTASYLWNYNRTGQKNPLSVSYAESGHASPKPLGGKILVLVPERKARSDDGGRYSEYTVKQDAVSPHVLRHFG
jgi:hypothetical protein